MLFGVTPSLQSNQEAGRALVDSLSNEFALDVDALRSVADLFLPDAPRGPFAIRIGATFNPDAPPAFEVWLNPNAQGRSLAPALIEEALVRLGRPSAWPVVGQELLGRGPELDSASAIVIDIGSPARRAPRLLVAHQECTPAELDDAAGPWNGNVLGAAPLIERLVPETLKSLSCPPPWTSREFPAAAAIGTTTTYVPVGAYVKERSVIEERVFACLDVTEQPHTFYRAILDVLASCSLGGREHVGLVRGPSGVGIEVGMSMGASPLEAVETYPASAHASGVMQIIDRFEHRDQITNHPFMRRLRREPVNLRHLWTLLANFQISISKNFARRLAGIAARVDDERIRCILAEQLNDEMGRGDFAHAHINLFSKMMSQLEPWRPVKTDANLLDAGKKLDPKLAEIYGAADVYESVGAVMAGEIFGKQMDQFLGDEFRRQNELDPSSLEWLMLHEQLEVDHADSSSDLARFVPTDSLEATWRGASDLSRAGWAFLDDVYRACYGGPAS
jgi:pyrroloquinoline quinone (PQQ) biosynthesis protein C